MTLAAPVPNRLFLFQKMAAPQQKLAVHMVRFDAARFDAGSFAAAGIDLPPAIARSVRKRQAEFFHGRLCARYALAALGADQARVQPQVGIGSQRNPLWPRGVIGSISHSATHAAALVLPQRGSEGIGIDIEMLGGLNDPASLHLVFSAQELEYLRTLDAENGAGLYLTLAFSAKESFFKAAFHLVQKHFDFDVMEVVALDSARAVIVLEQKKWLCSELPAGRRHLVQYTRLDAAQVITCCLLA